MQKNSDKEAIQGLFTGIGMLLISGGFALSMLENFQNIGITIAAIGGIIEIVVNAERVIEKFRINPPLDIQKRCGVVFDSAVFPIYKRLISIKSYNAVEAENVMNFARELNEENNLPECAKTALECWFYAETDSEKRRWYDYFCKRINVLFDDYRKNKWENFTALYKYSNTFPYAKQTALFAVISFAIPLLVVMFVEYFPSIILKLVSLILSVFPIIIWLILNDKINKNYCAYYVKKFDFYKEDYPQIKQEAPPPKADKQSKNYKSDKKHKRKRKS